MANSSGELRAVFERKVIAYTACDGIENIRLSRFRSADYLTLLLTNRETYGKGLGAIMSFSKAEAVQAAGKAVDELVSQRKQENITALTAAPLLIADNVETADLVTSGGLDFLDQWQATADAAPVAALVAAGAVILGKTTVQELGLGVRGTNASYGPAKNPYALGRIAGGASGGLAAAIAARVATLGLGVDSLGSLRIPAALCGAVAFRPTFGRYGDEEEGRGRVPVSVTLDTWGIVTRSVQDAQLMDRVLAGASGKAIAIVGPIDTKTLPTTSLAGVRIGLPKSSLWAGVDPSYAAVCTAAVEKLAAAGAVIVDIEASVPLGSALSTLVQPIIAYEILRENSRYMYESGAKTSVKDIVESSSGTERHLLDAWLSGSVSDGAVTPAAYRDVLVRQRPVFIAALIEAFAAANVEAVLYPAVLATACKIEQAADPACTLDVAGASLPIDTVYGRNAAVATAAGFPALTIPIGQTGDLPVAIELMGLPGSDFRVLELGRGVQDLYVHGGLAPPKLSAATFKA